MISIVYVSTATAPFGDAEISALLQKSREKNTRLGLTGLLLFKGDQFMQVLEGEEEHVVALYSVIAADPRHRDVKTVLSTSITERQFSEWSMAFQPVTDESLRHIPGYDGFLDSSSGSRKTWEDPSRAQWLLDWFRLRAA